MVLAFMSFLVALALVIIQVQRCRMATPVVLDIQGLNIACRPGLYRELDTGKQQIKTVTEGKQDGHLC